MKSRRHFFKQLSSGLIAVSTPGLFLPKLVKPTWRPTGLPGPWIDGEIDPRKIEEALLLRKQQILAEIMREFARKLRQMHLDGFSEMSLNHLREWAEIT